MDFQILGWLKRFFSQHQHLCTFHQSFYNDGLEDLSNFGGFQPQNLFSCVKWWNRFITAIWFFSDLIPKTPPEKSLHNIINIQKQTKHKYIQTSVWNNIFPGKTQTPRFCVKQLVKTINTEEQKHLHHLFGIQAQELRCTLLSRSKSECKDSSHQQIFHYKKNFREKTGFKGLRHVKNDILKI